MPCHIQIFFYVNNNNSSKSTLYDFLGLFVSAYHKKKKLWAIYEMTSGTLTQLESRPAYMTSLEHMIPYVSEDGNFMFLFDKGSKYI